MAKEYKWQARIDGELYQIECVLSNNRYILYANGEQVAAVYRKLFQDPRGGIIEKVGIAGKDCRFVVWEAQPDLEVDGNLLGAGCTYEEGFQRFRNFLKIRAIVYFCLAAGWAVLSLIPPVNVKGLLFTALLLPIGFMQLRVWKRLK